MGTGTLTLIAVLMAVASLAARWRFPAVAKPLATFALVGSISSIAWIVLGYSASKPWWQAGVVCGGLSIAATALDWLIIRWRARVSEPPPVSAFFSPYEDETTTLDIEGVDGLDIGRIDSTADKVAHVRNSTNLSIDDLRHRPRDVLGGAKKK